MAEEDKEKVVVNINETGEGAALEAGWDELGTEDPSEKDIATSEKDDKPQEKEIPTEKVAAEEEAPEEKKEEEVAPDEDTKKVPTEKVAAEEEAPEKDNEFQEFEDLVSKKSKETPPFRATVPHEQFHEEREKRKALRVELNELKATIAAQNKKPLESESYTKEIDPDIEELRARQAKFEQWQADQETLKTENAAKERQAVTQVNIANANEGLSAEGFPGFLQSVQAVSDKILQLASDDAEIIRRLDTPAGWKYVYKKHIFPEMQATFTRQVDKERIADKEALKKDANLVTTPRAIEKKPKEDNSWDMDTYAAMMEKNSLL